MSDHSVHVEFLKDVLAHGGRIEKARFSLQRGPLKSVEPTFYLTLEQNGVRSLQELPWTPELEKFLLFELARKLESPNDEAERFAAILLNNFATAESQHGEDYARAVLVELLSNKPEYNLAELLRRIPVHRPSHGSKHYAECADFLSKSIAGLQNEAILGLRYVPNEAISIMSAALRIALDESFSISASEMLFPRT
jgi:hypothetical protein